MLKVIEKAKNPEFVKKLRFSDDYEPFREDLLRRWKAEGENELPEILFSNFRLTFETGNRTVFQKRYFERRRALNLSALMSLIYPDEGKYLRRLEDVIFAICNEYTWCILAHLPTLTEIVPDHLDLFSTETGYALSEICAIFGDRLSPLIRSRIRCEVERRIIVPYTDGRRFGWETSTHNWAAVCIGGVIASVIYLFPERFEALRPRFDATVASYLSGFGEDGLCLEGIGYWSYGFGFFTSLADLVYDFTDGRVNYFSSPNVSEIAKYLQKMFLCEDCTVSFSDGQRNTGFNVGILHYLHHRLGSGVRLLPNNDFSLAEGCARWCLDLRKLVWFDPELKPESKEAPFTFYGENAAWFIKKAPLYSLAAKGGNNAEPHNHNDVGSFIIAQNGTQLFADLGAGTYTKQYFNVETRYDHLNCSSLGHSVAYFGDHKQKYGKEYGAKVLSVDDESFLIEMAGAYGIEELRSYKRHLRMTDTAITLTDTFEIDGSLPITERFLLGARPHFEKDGIRVAGLRIRLADPTQRVKVVEHTFEKIYTDKTDCTDFWFMDVLLSPDATSFEMTVEICSE